MNNIIEEYYENFNFPSVNKLYNLLKDDGHDIKKKDIEQYLNKKEEVQIFKEAKKVKTQQGHITAMRVNERWQLDIFYLIKYHRQNKNYNYILCALDVFTRKAYCIAMKLKDDPNVAKALEQLFDQADGYPTIITSDNDATFLSKEIQGLLNKHKIIHDVVPKNDHNSLGIIDRFARTLKTVLHKRFVKYSTTTWIYVLPEIIKNYNNSPHSAIDGIKPSQANTPENIYDIMELNMNKKNKKSTFKNPFSLGDKVRVEETGFHKKSEGKFTKNIYSIIDISGKRVILDNGKVYKYDMLTKIDASELPQEKKTDVLKKAKQDYKQELLLKRESQKEENIIDKKTRNLRNAENDVSTNTYAKVYKTRSR